VAGGREDFSFARCSPTGLVAKHRRYSSLCIPDWDNNPLTVEAEPEVLERPSAPTAQLSQSVEDRVAREQALVPSADGRMLYIVDSGEDMVAVMDTRSLEVVRTASVELDATGDAETDSETGRTSLAVTTDGATLFIASGSSPGTVSAIDTEALTLADRWASPLPASGLGLSLDGSALYIAGGGRIALVDTATGEARATVPTAVLEPIVGVHPLAGAADEVSP